MILERYLSLPGRPTGSLPLPLCKPFIVTADPTVWVIIARKPNKEHPKGPGLWLRQALLRWLPMMQGILPDLIRWLDGHKQLHSHWKATDDWV